MSNFKEQILNALSKELGSEQTDLEVPPKQEMGDFAFPCFSLAKELKKSPAQIAQELAGKISLTAISTKALGPYVNFFIDKASLASSVLKHILVEKENYAKKEQTKEIYLIESPGPNTNKPLHLGHLRNMLLGISTRELLTFQGKDARMINMVNDRGVHICKSIYAYQQFGEGKTPESENRKGDFFVGDYYIKYAQYAKEHPEEAEKAIQDLLVKWEENDPEVRALWKKMNSWTYAGFKETYEKLGMTHDKEYFESDHFHKGKALAEEGLSKGIFEKDEKGSVIINLEDVGLDKKVILRSNGTALYITQDMVLGKIRYDDYQFTKLIHVVGNEQDYHFKVLFEIYKRLGMEFADRNYHLSYGMVELPTGKMKSREGTVVDTDDLLLETEKLAREAIDQRYDSLSEEERAHRSQVIAKAAIYFHFLKMDPLKKVIYDPKESLSFEGETGPYVLYSYARISSLFRKAAAEGYNLDESSVKFDLLNTEEDRKLITLLGQFEQKAADACAQYRPSTIAHYVLDLASAFTEYYHAHKVLVENKDVVNARLGLLSAVQIVLKSALSLLCIDVLEQM